MVFKNDRQKVEEEKKESKQSLVANSDSQKARFKKNQKYCMPGFASNLIILSSNGSNSVDFSGVKQIEESKSSDSESSVSSISDPLE